MSDALLPDEDVTALDQVRGAPFKVHEEKAPCCACGEGGQWTVEYPDGSVLSQSWTGETGQEHAEEVADWMNEAWDLALDAAKSATFAAIKEAVRG